MDGFIRVSLNFSTVFDAIYERAKALAQEQIPHINLCIGDVIAIAVNDIKEGISGKVLIDNYINSVNEFRAKEEGRRATITIHKEINEVINEQKKAIRQEAGIKINKDAVIDAILITYISKRTEGTSITS